MRRWCLALALVGMIGAGVAADVDPSVELITYRYDALAEDPLVQDARSLVSARDQQFEDWLALGIFLAFLGGADAFVSAHLKDFPPPVELGVRPVGDRIEVGVSVRVGGG